MTIMQKMDPPATAMTAPPKPTPAHDARHLTAGGSTAQIVLDGHIYTLRITRAGKLILTK